MSWDYRLQQWISDFAPVSGIDGVTSLLGTDSVTETIEGSVGADASGSFGVDLEALAHAATGMLDVLKILDSEDVDTMAAEGAAFGHQRLGAAVTGFGDRWARGVNYLSRDTEEIARRAGECAVAYSKAEEKNADAIVQAVASGGSGEE